VFTTESILAIPDIDREMRVEADALDYATGGGVVDEVQRWQIEASGFYL